MLAQIIIVYTRMLHAVAPQILYPTSALASVSSAALVCPRSRLLSRHSHSPGPADAILSSSNCPVLKLCGSRAKRVACQ